MRHSGKIYRLNADSREELSTSAAVVRTVVISAAGLNTNIAATKKLPNARAANRNRKRIFRPAGTVRNDLPPAVSIAA